MKEPEGSNRESKQEEWHKFLNKYAGCLVGSPIERGDQGNFEQREKLKEF